MKITQVITDTLQEMDPADADIFAANAEDYLGKLENLDQEFRDVVNGADLDLIVMADKFPLRYFADTYGLRYRAAFSGCALELSVIFLRISFWYPFMTSISSFRTSGIRS